MKNKIEDLRNHLFATLEALQDDTNPMDIERAQAIAEVSKVIVESAKVEVAYAKAIGAATGTGFMGEMENKPSGRGLPSAPERPRLPAKGNGSA